MPASKTSLTSFLLAAFSAALGFMSGIALYGARVAVLEAQQSSFITELREVKTELIGIHSDIQTLTLQVKRAAYSRDSAALRSQPVSLVSSLCYGCREHRQPRPAFSDRTESLWCDTRGRGCQRYPQRRHKRKVKRAA